ncbi:hypothetical protein [uncultured Roseobacter sp.]|uniref:hypothetical protein n=1 Tax=uncultured Roseobacter sp. TaxID=114847 RepID=UPI002603507E|nr:hypothetical protein [uncultured Roseobacter sp.]
MYPFSVTNTYFLRLCCAASVGLAAVTAQGRTINELPALDSEPLDEFTLGELISTDALGGECIEEGDIDLAFYASGKGLRLPRTCLPEPCEQALTPFRLSQLMGRPADPAEWDTYFARYADVCRKEIVSFEDVEPIQDDGTIASFWTPILGAEEVAARTPAPVALPQSDILRAARSSAGQPRIAGFGGSARTSLASDDTGDTGSDDDEGDTGENDGLRLFPDGTGDSGGVTPGGDNTAANEDDTEAPAPVPLPFAASLMVAALGCLALLRRRNPRLA